MALAGALCLFVHAVAGFRNKSLRSLVAALLGVDYSAGQMSYDLRRLRLHGLIQRLPRTNTYVLTPKGLRVALFYTKVHARLLRPLLAADHPPASLDLLTPGVAHHRPRRRRLRRKRPSRHRCLKLVHRPVAGGHTTWRPKQDRRTQDGTQSPERVKSRRRSRQRLARYDSDDAGRRVES